MKFSSVMEVMMRRLGAPEAPGVAAIAGGRPCLSAAHLSLVELRRAALLRGAQTMFPRREGRRAGRGEERGGAAEARA